MPYKVMGAIRYKTGSDEERAGRVLGDVIALTWENVVVKLLSRRPKGAATEPPPCPAPICPECGAPVEYDLTCHTYGQNGRFYACMPCDSAVEYICVSRYDDENPGECDWGYTHGLNPGNPRAARNEEFRPPWLPEGQSAEGGNWVMPGVKMLGSS